MGKRIRKCIGEFCVKVIVCEDNIHKFNKIFDALIEFGVEETNVTRVCNLVEFSKHKDGQFDLCIVDVMMPRLPGETPCDTGIEIIYMSESYGSYKIPTIAITEFSEKFFEQRDKFAEHGCLLFQYDAVESWRNALRIILSQNVSKYTYDFIIFTAIKKERDAYLSIIDLKAHKNIFGLECIECEISGKFGLIALQNQMGLVNSAITTTLFLAAFKPILIAMTGICAGVKGETELGQLLIPEYIWEHQVGKHREDGFQHDNYQICLDLELRGKLSDYSFQDELVQKLEREFNSDYRPPRIAKPIFSHFTSGSSVINNEEKMHDATQTHRKTTGLDMEVYGFFKAAQMCGQLNKAFCVKSVVDFGDGKKDNSIHDYGAKLAAHFACGFISKFLSE